MPLSRRYFLLASAAVAAGFASLRLIDGCDEVGSDIKGKYARRGNGPVLTVPPGFQFQVISQAGEKMDDGLIAPGIHDGQCAFPAPGGKTILVCNHELDRGLNSLGPFGNENELLARIDRSKLYDNGFGKHPAIGGTTTLLYDTVTRKVEKQFLSLAGTVRNCAGGPTPWGSWITCEETTQSADKFHEQDHGYNFEVPARADSGLVKAIPIKPMGRFYHEAVAIDPATGIVYQTEDRPDGLIYRYIPTTPGNLLAGGRLQALKIHAARSFDTRNWSRHRVSVGDVLEVEWADLEDIESPTDELRYEGYFGGKAARFARAEGMWFGRASVYFACTNGGAKLHGQIWKYTPSPHEGRADESKSPGKLELFIEPEDSSIAENADNLTMAPWGDVFVCEDNDRDCKRLLRVTPTGKVIEFARNTYNFSELAGVTFSPDGSTLFVNIQNPGLTVAVWGPWKSLEGTGL